MLYSLHSIFIYFSFQLVEIEKSFKYILITQYIEKISSQELDQKTSSILPPQAQI